MAGKLGGVLAIMALIGGLFALSAPSQAADSATEPDTSECGPITLDMLFPHLDKNGNPIPTTTTTTIPSEGHTTSTTVPGQTTTTASGQSTTSTTAATTTTTTSDPDPTPPPPPPCNTWVYDMEWPVAVASRVFSSFGVDRDGGARRHKGNDILAPKLAPVVAVADGVVTSLHSTPPNDCCWMMITHDDGWRSLYVHLNNDHYLTDDGSGHGTHPALVEGSRVNAGDVIGWVGDSGNAEGTVPHLHFELRHPEGYSVDPFSSLQAAKQDLDLPTPDGPYRDDEGLAIGHYASLLITQGVFWPCDEVGLYFCPTRLAQPEETAQLAEQMSGLTPPLVEGRRQTLRFQEFVPTNRLSDVVGCEPIETCFESGITAGDVASMAQWVHSVTISLSEDETFDPTSQELVPARQSEIYLRSLGVIGICHEPFDDEKLINRSEVVELLTWLILGQGTNQCLSDGDPTS